MRGADILLKGISERILIYFSISVTSKSVTLLFDSYPAGNPWPTTLVLALVIYPLIFLETS